MADRRRRRRANRKQKSKWDVDLEQLAQVLLGMDPGNRERVKTAEIFMAARWQDVKKLEEADDNGDHLLDIGEWKDFWASDERGRYIITSLELSAMLFTILLDKKNRGRVTISEVVTFGNKCQRTWRELSSRGLDSALKKFSWFREVVVKTAPEPEPAAEQKEPAVDLETENAELAAAVEELEETVSDLREQLEDRETQIEAKDKKIEEQSQEIEKMSSEMWQSSSAFADELERAKKQLDDQAQEHDAQVASMNEKIAELQRELEAAISAGQIPNEFCNIPRHTDALREMEELQKDFEGALKMVAALEADKFTLGEQVKRQQRQAKRKEKELEGIAERMQAEEEKSQALESQVQSQQERLDELAGLEGELRRSRASCEEKDGLIAELKALLAQKDGVIAEGKQVAADRLADNDRLKDEIAMLKQALDQKGEEIAGLMQSSGDAAQSLEKLCEERDQEIGRLRLAEESAKHAAQRANEDVEEMKRRLREQQDQLDAKQSEILELKHTLQTELADKEAEAAKSAAEAKAREEELERLNARLADLERALEIARQDGEIPEHFCNIPDHDGIETLRAELEEAATMIAEVENAKLELEHKHDKLAAEAESLRAKLQEQVEKSDTLESELRQQKNEFDLKLVECENLEDDLRRARETIAEKDQLIEELKALLAQKDEHIGIMKELSDTLRGENEKLTDELAVASREIGEKDEEIRILMASADGATADLEKLIQQRDGEITQLTLKDEANRHELDHAKEEIEDLKRRLQELQDAANAKVAEILMLKERLDVQTAESHSLKLKNRRSTHTREQLQSTLQQQGVMVGSLEEQINALRQELAQSRQQQLTVVNANRQNNITYNMTTHDTPAIAEESADGAATTEDELEELRRQIAFRDGRILQLEKQLAKCQKGVRRASLMVQQVQSAGIPAGQDDRIRQLHQALHEATIQTQNAQEMLANKPARNNALLWKRLGEKIQENEKLKAKVENLERMLELSEKRRDANDGAFKDQIKEFRKKFDLAQANFDAEILLLKSELHSVAEQRNLWKKECGTARREKDLEVEKVLQRLQQQQEMCHRLHGSPKKDRVPQKMVGRQSSTTETLTATEIDSSQGSETNDNNTQVPSDSITLAGTDPINLSILDLQRVYVEGDFKVGVLPSELFCCGLLCFGQDCYCCSKPRRSNRVDDQSKVAGQ